MTSEEDLSLEQQIRESRDRLHVLEALTRVLEDPPALMELLAGSADSEKAVALLGERFGFDEIQAAAVVDLQLRRVTARERARLAEVTDEVADELRDLESRRP